MKQALLHISWVYQAGLASAKTIRTEGHSHVARIDANQEITMGFECAGEQLLNMPGALNKQGKLTQDFTFEATAWAPVVAGSSSGSGAGAASLVEVGEVEAEVVSTDTDANNTDSMWDRMRGLLGMGAARMFTWQRHHSF